jgi:Zn-dependent M28 family amino/carboxypeptidase
MVVGYTPGPNVDRRVCSEEDEQRVPALPFSNLYVARHSAKTGAPLLLIGAHWDSQMHSDNDVPSNKSLPDPGADDGASGVGVLLQLMRDLPKDDLGVSVGLLFLDGEDGFYDCYPLAGSLWYAAHPIEKPSAFVLLDMVGDPGAIYPLESNSESSAPGLQALLWSHGQASEEGRLHFTNATVSIEDDHLAFIHAGVPSVDLIDAGRPTVFPPQWDTAGDTVDKLDANMLALVGGVLVATMRDPGLAFALDSSSSRTPG